MRRAQELKFLHFIRRRGKKTQGYIRYRQRAQKEKLSQYNKTKIAPSTPAAADPLPPQPNQLSNRFLEFDAQANPPAVANLQEDPPPPSYDGSVSASPSPPCSPIIRCSQELHHRQAQQDDHSEDDHSEDGIIFTMDETLADKRRREESALEAPPGTNTALIVRDREGQLHIRKDHCNAKGQAPRCYVTTGYKGPTAPDGPGRGHAAHQAYMVYNHSDLVWAQRLKFHLRRFEK